MMWRRSNGSRLLALGVAVLVAVEVARTHLRNRDWRTRETLLRSVLRLKIKKDLVEDSCVFIMGVIIIWIFVLQFKR